MKVLEYLRFALDALINMIIKHYIFVYNTLDFKRTYINFKYYMHSKRNHLC